MTRSYEWREMRLGSEYVQKRFPGKEVIYRARLGKISEELLKKATGSPKSMSLVSSLRYVDAIVIDPPRVWLIEFKVDAELGAIAQLEYYKILFLETPDYEKYKSWEIKLLIVTTREITDMVRYAAMKGIEYDVYLPEWIYPYLVTRRVVETI
jgi:hypothetical protein